MRHERDSYGHDDLPADAVADVMLLTIEPRLLAMGDVAVVPGRHAPLLRADAVVGAMQAGSLRMRHLTFFDFPVDTGVLVAQAVVDFLAPRVLGLPGRVGHGGSRKARQRDDRGDGGENGADRFRHKRLLSAPLPGSHCARLPGFPVLTTSQCGAC